MAAAWVAAREAGMVVVARVVRAAAVETVVTRAVEVRRDGWRRGRRQADTVLEGAACVPGDASAKCARSKDSGNGGDLWVMLEECSACFASERKEEHGRL